MTSDPSAATPARPTVAPAPPLPPSTTRAAALQSRRSAVPPLASYARPTTGPHRSVMGMMIRERMNVGAVIRKGKKDSDETVTG